jgi:hypothetical protein
MWPTGAKLVLGKTSFVLVLALVTLAGCADIQVVDLTPAAVTPSTFASPLTTQSKAHDLAVLTLDFDPPLNYQQLIMRPQSAQLLVAVENRGTSTERDVIVRVELTTPEDPDMVLTQAASLASIAPGEIQVASFTRLGDLPYHQIYHLEVMVDSVNGESNLGDNRKAFDIQIHRE